VHVTETGDCPHRRRHRESRIATLFGDWIDADAGQDNVGASGTGGGAVGGARRQPGSQGQKDDDDRKY
jgi:hypothetical protein